jgi:hypothetical protein
MRSLQIIALIRPRECARYGLLEGSSGPEAAQLC